MKTAAAGGTYFSFGRRHCFFDQKLKFPFKILALIGV
jgi:hypothetical protein